MKNGESVGVRKPRGVVIVIDVYSETRDGKIRERSQIWAESGRHALTS